MRRPSQFLVLALAFCVAIAATFTFAFRTGRNARGLRFENEPIRPWMSVPFIAHTHHVPAAILFEALGVAPYPRDRRPLRVIAREQGRPVDDLIRAVDRALVRAGHVHPAPVSPGGQSP